MPTPFKNRRDGSTRNRNKITPSRRDTHWSAVSLSQKDLMDASCDPINLLADEVECCISAKPCCVQKIFWRHETWHDGIYVERVIEDSYDPHIRIAWYDCLACFSSTQSYQQQVFVNSGRLYVSTKRLKRPPFIRSTFDASPFWWLCEIRSR